jgi:hypothetical protein
VLHQHPERRNQNALRALLPNQASAPALPKRPLADRRLLADQVPDAGAGWRGMSTVECTRSQAAIKVSVTPANIMRSDGNRTINVDTAANQPRL